jgi:2',3'-cyclic-nucleotide 2'-phosphodiesterase (5'-nucleotidase family)
MKKVNLKGLIFALAVSITACAPKHYTVKNIQVSRVEMDSTWDNKGDSKMDELVNSFKTRLDDEMNEQIGVAAQTLIKGLPQSLLNNFTADAMLDYGSELWGAVDFAVINNGGIRSILNQGTITVGNIFEIYPFNNRFVLLELPGKAVKDFFDSISAQNGTGLSKNIQLVVKDQTVQSLQIGGLPLDENKSYKIATINYLAEGNDGMAAFLQASKYIDSNIMIRDVMIEYIKDLTAKNKEVDAKLDDRIIIQ